MATLVELNQMIEDYGSEVLTFCVRLTKSKMDAEDLYQKTFLKATQICQTIDPESNPKSYIIGVAINIWKNERRKLAWRQRLVPTISMEVTNDTVQSFDDEPEVRFLKTEQQRQVADGLNKLSEKYRMPLILYYTSEFSVKEISEIMKLPEGTVKSRLYKGRKLMKNYLEVNGYDQQCEY